VARVTGVIHDGGRSWESPPDGPLADTADELSLFEIGSLTKAFTGVLLADMSLRGEIALDDPLSRHLPRPRPAWRHREPTLLELATHRSGLGNVPQPMKRGELRYLLGLSSRNPWVGVTAAEYERLVARESPRCAPGRRIRYSSMGFGLLGDALAARAGVPYEELLRERVLAPLGMEATAVTGAPAWSARLLEGHSGRGRPRPPMNDLIQAGGSLRSNARDMLTFLAACLEPPAEPPGPALELAQQPHARWGRNAAIGLGWIISTRRRRPKTVWHIGGTWGFTSFAGFAPDQGTAAVVLSNRARPVGRLGLKLVAEPPSP
jgi:CubicO group peptidase (beta-lactamase class C family)